MPLSAISLSVTSTPEKATSGTSSSTSVNTTAVSIQALNANRKGFTLVNQTGKTIFLGYANTVTSSNGIPVPDGTIYEMPSPIYTGAIFAIVASAGAVSPVAIEFA